MKYLALDFHFSVQSQAHFPLYTGSMLRGAFGNSLRHAVCMMKGKNCADCMLAASCIFPRLFTATARVQNCHAAPLAAPPFCIEPPLDGVCDLACGAPFSFRLKLFSYAVDYLPYFVHAFKLAGQRGMGQNAKEGQGKMALVDVCQDGRSLYDADSEQLTPAREDMLPVPALDADATPATLRLELLTPLRFKQANRLSTNLDFAMLIRLILRRLSSLQALEGQDFRLPVDDFAALQKASAAMRTLSTDLRWRDWRRYSGRQDTAMQLGGLVGSVRYAGPAATFARYFQFASAAHLGKQTSFGLGAMSWEEDGVQGDIFARQTLQGS
ncbi:MAG: CRISPR system precrRNA processing endoribonuclease RAMP protein Cas6 [Desulfovibrio sp.]|nr:CRISPR system precrRNA processing endoribonuclease RAMP protein Cas6 [Desulfovibrio sp.]